LTAVGEALGNIGAHDVAFGGSTGGKIDEDSLRRAACAEKLFHPGFYNTSVNSSPSSV